MELFKYIVKFIYRIRWWMEELEKKVKQYVKEIDQILNEIEETKRGRNKLRLEIEDVKGQIQRKYI